MTTEQRRDSSARVTKTEQHVYYVSGPYTATWEPQARGNINAARLVALDLWRQGHAVICPHLNTAMFPEGEGINYLAGDLAFLRRLRPGGDKRGRVRWQTAAGPRPPPSTTAHLTANTARRNLARRDAVGSSWSRTSESP